MRMWEPGDPIEGGNDTGIPDIPYFEYLRGEYGDDDYYGDSHYGGGYSQNSDYGDSASGKSGLSMDDLIRKAKEFFDNGNYVDALDYYEAALNRSYSEQAKYGKAKCLRKLGRNEEASQLFFELGDRYAWGDDGDIAAEYFKEAIESNPNNDEALDHLGYVLRNLGRCDEALAYYRRVRNKNVDWAMARCYMELKKYREAIPLLDNVIENCRYCEDHVDEKCECLIGLGRKSEAIDEYKKFIKFLMDNDCYWKALDTLDKLSKIAPGDSFIEDNREKCLRDTEKFEVRLKKVLNAMNNYSMYNPKGLDEDDLRGFIIFVSQQSGESIDNIVKWYNSPVKLSDSYFSVLCNDGLHYSHWDKIIDMHNQGRLR